MASFFQIFAASSDAFSLFSLITACCSLRRLMLITRVTGTLCRLSLLIADIDDTPYDTLRHYFFAPFFAFLHRDDVAYGASAQHEVSSAYSLRLPRSVEARAARGAACSRRSVRSS